MLDQEEPSDRQIAIERLDAEVTEAEWRDALAALDSERSPVHADWSNVDGARSLGEIMCQLAAIKVSVPANNAEELKETHNRTIENHIKLALAVAGSRENLAMFLEFVQSRLASQPGEAQRRLAEQTLLVWMPVAEVVGLHQKKTDLEDAAFPILYPEEHTKIRQAYRDLREDEAAQAQLERFQEQIYERLSEDEGLAALGDYTVEIETRRKTDYSVWRKCKKKGLKDFRISDLIALRVVISIDSPHPEASEPIAHCYAAAGLLCDMYEPVPGRIKDYIDQPKANGYQSIHLTVHSEETSAPLEIQIRTAEMHRRAEESPDMSHISYDAAGKHTPGTFELSGYRKSVGLYRWRDGVAEAIRGGRVDHWREFWSDQVMLFTPDGNLHEIPVGSTALDASFAIHSRRALRTRWIRVNGKPIDFGDEVSFGDCIDVTYGKTERWTPDWSKRVTMKRSRDTLRKAWKRAEAPRLQAMAIERIEAFCRQEWNIENPLDALTEQDKADLLRKYSARSFEALLCSIGARDSMGRDRRTGEEKKKGIGSILFRIQRNLDLSPAKRRLE